VLDAQVADAVAKGAHAAGRRQTRQRPVRWCRQLVRAHGVCQRQPQHGAHAEESFGPIIGIQKVSGDAEAVKLMNDTRYGLTAGVYTPDQERAQRLLAQVNAGSVYWNCCDRVSPRLPWSGHGDSGVGLTLSTYGIQTFTRPKAWHLKSAG
jgi:acyl-CoA reductase-like NAD-dependent aldehyde dehydrogenase